MAIPLKLRRSLHWLGSLFAIVGIVFVALRLHDYQTQIDFSRFSMMDCAVAVGFAIIYGLANLLLALAWWHLLSRFGAHTSRRWAVRVYGVSQLAKYVPGNIFHLTGRQAIGMAAGVPGWALAKSSIWELGLIVIAGGLFGFLVLPLFLQTFPIFVSLGIFVLFVCTGVNSLARIVGKSAGYAFSYYVGFLLVSGSVFVALVTLISGFSNIDLAVTLLLLGAFVVAWLIGLVTPGAPAGVGIRELVLLFLLKGLVVEADLLLAVTLGRFVTVVGDVLFFALACCLKNQKEIAVT